MADRFVVIDVAVGDAFFLQKGEQTFLVDGGQNREALPQLFEAATGRKSVDILVCTHNDADHANGVLGFLESHLTCSEVWLPGSWTSRLRDLLKDPGKFVTELATEVDALEILNEGPGISLETLPNFDTDSIDQRRIDQQQGSIEELEQVIGDSLVGDGDYDPLESINPPWLIWEWIFNSRSVITAEKTKLFLEAIKAAKRIRDIAVAAYNRGIQIRWFEFDSSQGPSKGNALLQTVNARQIIRMAPRYDALFFLYLTKVNRECLVLYSPPTEGSPSVLFCGDSNLDFRQTLPLGENMLITAPHHGSESNAQAYTRLANELAGISNATWVRSDSNSKKRPGNSYLSMRGSRYCTLCRGSHLQKARIRFVARGSNWCPIVARKCHC